MFGPFHDVPALVQRTTATSFGLILLCYRLTITRYPAGLPFKQNPHWFTFQRNCRLDHFTLLPCHTMFWSDLHVHFRLASPPCGHRAGRQSSHCPCGQSSIANIQAFTALETHCVLSKGAESLLMNALHPPCPPSPHPNEAERKPHDLAVTDDSFAQCRSAGRCSGLATNCFLLCQEEAHRFKHKNILMTSWLKREQHAQRDTHQWLKQP